MRFGVFAFFQALRSLVRLGWLFFLGLRLFFAVVVVLRVIARHCIAFCHASDSGWGVSYCNVLCAFAPNYGVLVVARILIALVSGTLVAIAMTYAPDVTTEQYRTKLIAWVFSGFSIASVVGVPVGTWVANTFGWRWAFHLVNVLTVVLIVLMVMVLPRNSRIVKIGFLPQFRLFFDRRIQLGVLAVVFGAFGVRRRRLEYAGALHSGQSKGAQLLEIAVETLIWSGLACASSAALLGAMRAPCAIFAGVMVSSVLVGMTIHETQLFRFFKQR